METIRLDRTFVHLANEGAATAVPVTADFWTNMPAIFSEGRMLSVLPQERDWEAWEMHPQGDEIILQLSGRVRFLTDRGEVAELGPGEALVMPAGTWHSAEVLAPGETLFLTAGAGTRHRPRAAQG